MRSIRSSTMTYLVILLIITLAVIGVVIEHVTEEALAARESAGRDLIEARYKDQCKAEAERIDEALKKQIKILYAAMTTYHQQEWDDFSSRYRNQLYDFLTLAFLNNPLAETAWTATQPHASTLRPISQFYFASLAPISKETIEKVNDAGLEGEYHGYQQINSVPANSTARGAWEWPSESLGGRKLQDPKEIDAQLAKKGKTDLESYFETFCEDYTIPGSHEETVRVAMAKLPPLGGRPGVGPPGRGPGGNPRGGFGGPSRPQNQVGPLPNADPPRPLGMPVPMNSLPRLYIQCARPKAAIDKALAKLTDLRDQEIEGLFQDIRLSRNTMRLQLLIVGLLALMAVCVGVPVVVGTGLRPIGKLSDAVSRVSERDFKLPFEGDDLVRELVPIHSRLTQTLDLLRRAFSREKQAVADISHELRTPIAALMATIDVALRKTRTPEQYRTALEECRLISKQLGQLVERIMTLASLDAGNDRTEVSRTDAVELATGCAAVIRPLAAANEIQVHIHPPDDLIELDTDPAKLREVLMNLLHNAVEYNRPNGSIDLRLQREKSNAIFEVRDTGIGMTPEVKEKIFERFFRADPSRHATGVHAGLGLAIVKEYVARLHGEIIVESEAGVGTIFRVVLPALPANEDSLENRSHP